MIKSLQDIINLLTDLDSLYLIITLIIPLTYFIRYIKSSKLEMTFIAYYKNIWINVSLFSFISLLFIFILSVQNGVPLSIKITQTNVILGMVLAFLLMVATVVSQKLFSLSSGIKYEPVIFDNDLNRCNKDWDFVKVENTNEKFLFRKITNHGVVYRFVQKESCRIYERENPKRTIPKMIYSSHLSFWTTLMMKMLLIIIFGSFIMDEQGALSTLLSLFLTLIFFSSIIIMLLEYFQILKKRRQRQKLRQ